MKTDTYWIGLTTVLLAVCLVAGLAAGLLAGCITTQNADGSVTTQMDLAAVQAALATAQGLWDLYQANHPTDTESDEAAELQSKIEFWEGILTRLLELRDAGVPKATVTVPVAELPVGGAK